MIVFINVFTVEPANQDKVVETLRRVTDDIICTVAGFLSATLHRSPDGTKVAMYARWRSIEDYEAMRQDVGAQTALAGLADIARFEPGMYEVVEEFIPIY